MPAYTWQTPPLQKTISSNPDKGRRHSSLNSGEGRLLLPGTGWAPFHNTNSLKRNALKVAVLPIITLVGISRYLRYLQRPSTVYVHAFKGRLLPWSACCRASQSMFSLSASISGESVSFLFRKPPQTIAMVCPNWGSRTWGVESTYPPSTLRSAPVT